VRAAALPGGACPVLGTERGAALASFGGLGCVWGGLVTPTLPVGAECKSLVFLAGE